MRAALIESIERGDTGYAEPGGLFESFAAFAQRRFGWAPDPGRMALVPDVMAGIVELLRHLTDPGDAVVITPPVYPPFFEGIPEAGRRIVEVPLAAGELDLEGLEAAFAAGARHLPALQPAQPDRPGRSSARGWRRWPRSPNATACSCSPTRSTRR